MRIDFHISERELGKFRVTCEAAIRNVGEGTKAATEYAAWSIMSDSLGEVPVDTGTLISSAFMGVSRRTDIKNYRYGAILGYGSPDGLSSAVDFGPVEWLMEPTNGVNPKSGLTASTYAARVHEDLDMPHPNGGKAKFLEDPIRNWAAGKFQRTVMTYWKTAIEIMNLRLYNTYNPSTRKVDAVWHKKPKTIRRFTIGIHSSSTQRGGDYVNRGGHTDEF